MTGFNTHSMTRPDWGVGVGVGVGVGGDYHCYACGRLIFEQFFHLADSKTVLGGGPEQFFFVLHRGDDPFDKQSILRYL